MRIIFLLIFCFVLSANAQSDFKFDYLLEYTNSLGEEKNYYINSKDDSYILCDASTQDILREDYSINFNISLQGKLRFLSVVPDVVDNNKEKVQVVENGVADTIINGKKCKKYVYRTNVIEGSIEDEKKPITYEMYIAEDPLNSVGIFNKNEALFPDSIKFDDLPKGLLVEMKNLENETFSAFSQLILKKVIKLDKVLEVPITNRQITKFLLDNQE